LDQKQTVGLWNYKARDSEAFFSEMQPEQERLRPVPWDAHYEWDETSMFGFNIPEHGIDCIIYYWHHPTMKTVYGGIMIWEGLNENQLSCAYSDYRLAMPMPLDITDCTYANGVRIKMIEPMKEFDIAFDDDKRNTHLKLRLRAIMPPACRYNNNHITQAMKTSGELVLNGRSFKIDGYHSRDRSWNECRNESHLPVPPINWSVGIVDETFAFHHVSYDNRRHRPEWGSMFSAHGDDNNVLWGYVWEDFTLHGIISVDQRTTYAWEPFRPERVETVITASNGKRYAINGRQVASTQIQCWPNMSANFSLMEWDCGDKGMAYGDIQMCAWHDAHRLMESLNPARRTSRGAEAGIGKSR
jgi:hypothetical protein